MSLTNQEFAEIHDALEYLGPIVAARRTRTLRGNNTSKTYWLHGRPAYRKQVVEEARRVRENRERRNNDNTT